MSKGSVRISILVAPVLCVASLARADAIGPPPEPVACPSGASSVVAGRLTHGQSSYCAPAVCTPGTTRAGFHCAPLPLQIGFRAVPQEGGHGLPPRPTKLPRGAMDPGDQSVGLAEVTGACTPDHESEPITASADPFGGVRTDDVALGCWRVNVWVPDAPPPDHVPAPTSAPTPAAPPTQSHGGCSATRVTSTPLAALALLAIAGLCVVARRRR